MYKYEEISESIRNEIIKGKYPAGGLLPDQNQLAERFNTTRITIRKALQALVIEGIVYSKRGSGTFVRKDFENYLHDQGSDVDKPLGTTRTHQGKKVTSKVLGLDARLPNDEEQSRLLIDETDPVYVIDRVRYLNDEVFSLEHTIMPTKIAKITNQVLEGSIYGYLDSEFGLKVSGSHRIIEACKATKNDIDAQIAKKSDPVLVINQVSYLEDGTPFELSESRFPYNRSQVIADINLEN